MDNNNIVYKTYSEMMNAIPDMFDSKLEAACIKKIEQTDDSEE